MTLVGCGPGAASCVGSRASGVVGFSTRLKGLSVSRASVCKETFLFGCGRQTRLETTKQRTSAQSVTCGVNSKICQSCLSFWFSRIFLPHCKRKTSILSNFCRDLPTQGEICIVTVFWTARATMSNFCFQKRIVSSVPLNFFFFFFFEHF